MSNPAVKPGIWSYVLDQPTRLLVVDDDPILREFASVYLATPTATVETAANGEIALQLLKNGQFDLALLDIEMPGLDGFALLEAIRAEPSLRGLPVMMLTWHEDIASIDRAHALGANAFATKPVNWRLLSYHIRYVLRACQVEGELGQQVDYPPTGAWSSDNGPGSIAPQYRSELLTILQIAKQCQLNHLGMNAPQLIDHMRRVAALADTVINRLLDSTDGEFDGSSGTSSAVAPDSSKQFTA